MKRILLLCSALVVVLMASCGSRISVSPAPADTSGSRISVSPAPADTPGYLMVRPELLPTPTPVSAPVQVEIGGKSILVDKAVEGPLCNDTWSGTVYVTRNVQVYPWEGKPTFLKDCNLTIEPGTVIYVAAHGDKPYYKGCSCHTGPAKP